LVYCEEDKGLRNLLDHSEMVAEAIPYGIPAHYIEDGMTFLTGDGTDNTRLSIFGKHNLMNLNGARLVCEKLGVSNDKFLEAISSFQGASNRLELVKRSAGKIMFKDFAHSPSKVGATVTAVREQFLNHHLAACLELHTFSSLNEEFLMEYHGTLLKADEAIVYFNPRTIEHKKLEQITEGQVRSAFGGGNLRVFTDSQELTGYLGRYDHEKQVFLMMTSGNFDGVDFESLAEEVIYI
jgi:UDP-N-acetylmuramate: L-alanyl-gamma-D-glutamyl-meso-diaminopimelate ligase